VAPKLLKGQSQVQEQAEVTAMGRVLRSEKEFWKPELRFSPAAGLLWH